MVRVIRFDIQETRSVIYVSFLKGMICILQAPKAPVKAGPCEIWMEIRGVFSYKKSAGRYAAPGTQDLMII